MREYRHHATDQTIEALRRLRRPWAGYRTSADALVVALADGGAVRIGVEHVAVEPAFEAFRLGAAVEADAASAGPSVPAGAFAAGGNDVVVFRSETWIEQPDASDDGTDASATVVQYTGSPLQRSDAATAVCAVDDAVVVASAAGSGLLVRCGVRPHTLDVVTDAGAIARFLVERQYGAADPGR